MGKAGMELQFSGEAVEARGGGADGIGDEIPGGVGVASDIGVGDGEDGDELDDLVDGAQPNPHEDRDDGEGDGFFGVEEHAGGFVAGQGGGEEPDGVDELVVAGEVWREAQCVEDGCGWLVVWVGCCSEWIGELWVDGDCAAAHVHEPPECEEPEDEWGKADAEMQEHGQGDEYDHRERVEEELGVALAEGEGREYEHVEDDEGDKQRGGVGSSVMVHVDTVSGFWGAELVGIGCGQIGIVLCRRVC